jgi:hypothetical protein
MIDLERTQQLEELAKIKVEIEDLLIQKAEIVKDINIPIYKAKAEAEKIIKEAKDEANATVSAANKIFEEAKEQHAKALELLHTAKGGIEELKAGQAKLAQDKIDFDGERFAHENHIRQHRNELNDQAIQNRANADNLQQSLIEVKQREDSADRCEAEMKRKESFIAEQQDAINVRNKTLDDYSIKIETQQKATEQEKAEILGKEKDLVIIKAEIEATKVVNQKILDEIIMRKADLTKQQKDLARQIEILDNSKTENDEKTKALKEQQRLIELKIRQNEEKIATLKTLRGEDK